MSPNIYVLNVITFLYMHNQTLENELSKKKHLTLFETDDLYGSLVHELRQDTIGLPKVHPGVSFGFFFSSKTDV